MRMLCHETCDIVTELCLLRAVNVTVGSQWVIGALPYSSAGCIITMVSIGEDFLLTSRELPLDKLCAEQDLSAKFGGFLSPSSEKPFPFPFGTTSLVSHSADMAAAVESPTNALMNLTADSRGVSDSASIVLLNVKVNGLAVVSEQSLPGLITPDRLVYMVIISPEPCKANTTPSPSVCHIADLFPTISCCLLLGLWLCLSSPTPRPE